MDHSFYMKSWKLIQIDARTHFDGGQLLRKENVIYQQLVQQVKTDFKAVNALARTSFRLMATLLEPVFIGSSVRNISD